MNKYFEEISGYQDIKDKLEIFLDTLNKRTEYLEKGVGVDNAFLILGEAGTGNTLIANCFTNATGRLWMFIKAVKANE